ncbi:glycerophosphocholine cholinephosphodiesterase ENPP6-like [Neocloeon triangulifer]|uniref:glycerophosphocholine cholinephosphodiesterase ENPP6-like n=1 Tax=Neocloeon triangulifer TaxID=2078957 RepID=UPI00286F45DC|nr:glycerophosphocholine cholinephosphodiesterase ENPP6-like [Neocloeon triangulifer]
MSQIAHSSPFTMRLVFGIMMLLGVLSQYLVTVISAKHNKNPLVVLMLDGFRYNYLDKVVNNPGGFNEFLTKGVRAEWVNGVFPTLSYPSWTTLSTGLYPESHGILGNYFFSRDHNKQFLLEGANNETFWWSKAEPIWTTATKNGLRVATILWSRSDVPVHGVLPEKNQGYFVARGVQAIEKTLNKVVSYLDEGFDLVMAYGEHIDNMGHSKGPESYEVQQGLLDVGKALQEFFNALEIKNLKDKTNIVIVSDHGMTSHTSFINLYENLPKDDILHVMDQGALALVYLKEGHSPTNTYETLKKATKSISVYLKEEIPKSFNYSKSQDCPDILVVAKPGYTIKGALDDFQVPETWKETSMRGLHGYLPSMPDMRTIFFGIGPGFKKMGIMVPPIDLVDIYQIYCNLLQIPAQPNNGTFEKVKNFLVKANISDGNSMHKFDILFMFSMLIFKILM